jgi:hypothetical protein
MELTEQTVMMGQLVLKVLLALREMKDLLALLESTAT